MTEAPFCRSRDAISQPMIRHEATTMRTHLRVPREGRARVFGQVLQICRRAHVTACSENPPKTRTQKPNTGGVRMLQKQVFRIHWSSEHVGAAKGKAPFAGGAPVLAVHRRPAIFLLSIRVPASTTAFRPG